MPSATGSPCCSGLVVTMAEHERGRPGEKAAPNVSNGNVSLAAAAPEVAARHRWAYSLLRRAKTPAPRYGSTEWAALADADPRKVAACVRAAECWVTSSDNLVDDLHADLHAARQAHKEADDGDYVARWRAHRTEWSRRTSAGKPFAQRRAEQLEAANLRAGDYAGGRGARG